MRSSRPVAARSSKVFFKGNPPRVKRSTLPLLLLPCLLAGCTVPVITGAIEIAQYGTSTFNKGSLETYFPNTVDECVIAARTMVSQLGLRPITDVPRDEDGFLYLKVRDEANEDIFIRVRRRADVLTMVSVRVGVLGDEPYSNALMRHITDLLDPDKKFDTPPPDLRRPSTARPVAPIGDGVGT